MGTITNWISGKGLPARLVFLIIGSLLTQFYQHLILLESQSSSIPGLSHLTNEQKIIQARKLQEITPKDLKQHEEEHHSDLSPKNELVEQQKNVSQVEQNTQHHQLSVSSIPTNQNQKRILPKRLITVIGPESSGILFIANTLGKALGLHPKGRNFLSQDGELELQQLTLPWGSVCEKLPESNNTDSEQSAEGINIVEALVPTDCFRYEQRPHLEPKTAEHNWQLERKNRNLEADGAQHNLPQDNNVAEPPNPDILAKCRGEVKISHKNSLTCGAKCGEGDYDGLALYPQRFFVNISSHIDWYEQRGVEVTVVLPMRDRSIAKQERLKVTCHIPETVEKEDEVAFLIMREALSKYGSLQDPNQKDRIVTVSYEGLMELKEVYLFELYQQLGIKSTFVPTFADGNANFVTESNNGLPPKPKEYVPPPPKQNLLAKKVITVFGPESSGTTFLSTALGVAIGAFPSQGQWIKVLQPGNPAAEADSGSGLPMPEKNWLFKKSVDRRVMSEDGEWEIQHLSLPWGWFCEGPMNEDTEFNVVEALVPSECFRYELGPHLDPKLAENLWYEDYSKIGKKFMTKNYTWDKEIIENEEELKQKCREIHISEDNVNNSSQWTCGAKCGKGKYDGYALYPQRFSVNITSHIDWYLSRGVDITVILSMRDRSISEKGKLKGHCQHHRVRNKEDEIAVDIMKDALSKYGKNGSRVKNDKQRAIAISYEGLMGMQESYLFQLYQQLGINSTYVPKFSDGNAKYVVDIGGEEEGSKPPWHVKKSSVGQHN